MNRKARFASIIAFCAMVWLGASAADAARVVDVRVGKHPGFTRVVFELDAPAGYRIERGGADNRELVVLMDAQGKGQRVATKLALIESVELEPQGFRSVGRIWLARSELRLKEMILANPPRIVLDVLRPEARPIVRLPAAPASKVAKATVKPEPAPIAKVAAAPPVPAKRAAAAAEPKRLGLPKELLEADPRLREIVLDGIEVEDVEVAPNQQAGAPQVEDASPQVENAFIGIAPPPGPAEGLEPEPEDSTPAAVAGTKPSTDAPPIAVARSRSPSASPAMEPEASFDLFTAGIAGGGLLLLAGGLFIWRRRRAGEVAPFDFDDDSVLGDDAPFAEAGVAAETDTNGAFGESTSEPVAAGEVEPSADLFAGFENETEQEPASHVAVTEPAFRDNTAGDNTATAIAEPMEEGTPMDMHTDSAPTRVMDMTDGPLMGTAPQADQSDLVRDLERRVLSLETRLEEMLEGRERLEKQMSAQTEELRVQRAAIARTQRAVRNMNRSEEDAPTEPALRDPSRPEGNRSE